MLLLLIGGRVAGRLVGLRDRRRHLGGILPRRVEHEVAERGGGALLRARARMLTHELLLRRAPGRREGGVDTGAAAGLVHQDAAAIGLDVELAEARVPEAAHAVHALLAELRRRLGRVGRGLRREAAEAGVPMAAQAQR
eukprot:scaffold73267_cov67-Phaeocystis_antarctica.AAC.5